MNSNITKKPFGEIKSEDIFANGFKLTNTETLPIKELLLTNSNDIKFIKDNAKTDGTLVYNNGSTSLKIPFKYISYLNNNSIVEKYNKGPSYDLLALWSYVVCYFNINNVETFLKYFGYINRDGDTFWYVSCNKKSSICATDTGTVCNEAWSDKAPYSIDLQTTVNGISLNDIKIDSTPFENQNNNSWLNTYTKLEPKKEEPKKEPKVNPKANANWLKLVNENELKLINDKIPKDYYNKENITKILELVKRATVDGNFKFSRANGQFPIKDLLNQRESLPDIMIGKGLLKASESYAPGSPSDNINHEFKYQTYINMFDIKQCTNIPVGVDTDLWSYTTLWFKKDLNVYISYVGYKDSKTNEYIWHVNCNKLNGAKWEDNSSAWYNEQIYINLHNSEGTFPILTVNLPINNEIFSHGKRGTQDNLVTCDFENSN